MSVFQSNKIFRGRFINVGDWKIDSFKKFPHENILSADTETKMYMFDDLINEDQAKFIYNSKKFGPKFFKQNVIVKPYAFMLSNGKNFLLFEEIEDFLLAISLFNAKIVFWYNAKFDFSIFDYYFLTNDWKLANDIITDKNKYGKLPSKTYSSLDGDFGQRYQMQVWYEYTNRKYQVCVHKTKFLDICNVFSGGLAKNLKDFNIYDDNGLEVRKLSMNYDYANPENEEDLKYMINDTKGLALLANKIDEVLKDLTGFSLFKCDFMTAGGLAKKSFLKFMFEKSNNENIQLFRKFFPITIEEDNFFRLNRLYLGGKCFVNKDKIGKKQNNVYKYDVNSMYPDKMRNMKYPFGNYTLKKENELDKNKLHIYHISNFKGVLKENMVAVYQDSLSGEYEDNFEEISDVMLWEEELETIGKFYYLDFKIINIYEYTSVEIKGMKKFVDTFYEVKRNAKGSVRQGAKLLLNSAYGKLAQRTDRIKCHYELNEDGIVHLKKEEEVVDENSMLNVVIGSRVTALSRVALMNFILEITNNNPKQNFCYCDTDSVLSLTKYDNTDDTELGKMKFEGFFESAVFLAPKTYMLYDGKEFDVHCKGVNTKAVKRELENVNDFDSAMKIFRPNRTFSSLSGLNVKGGKALVYVNKYIVRDENEVEVYEMNKELEDFEDLLCI